MSEMELRHYDSPIGRLHIAVHHARILAISFTSIDPDHLSGLLKKPSLELNDAHPDALETELERFFRRRDPRFRSAISLHGSGFQLAVWKACLSIPYGETRSYGDLARMISRPGAVRAVGSALARNPIPLIVPCHRVIRSDGGPGGFGGGIERKEFMLKIEKGDQ